jgi:hypothetical protein
MPEITPNQSPIGPNRKEENFEAISPRHTAPMLISTTAAKKSSMGGLGWVFFILFLAAAAAVGYMYIQLEKAAQRVTELESQQALSTEDETRQSGQGLNLVELAGKHILLPSGEPKITTVSDASATKNAQPSYSAISTGDVILTYSNEEIVYSPTNDKVLYVRSLNGQTASVPGQQVAGAETRATQGVVTIDVRNGSGVSGAAAKAAETLKGMTDYQVKNIGNAGKTTYNTTILVNLTGKNIAGLEKQFKTTALTSLPVGEAASGSDVVIIVGKQ